MLALLILLLNFSPAQELQCLDCIEGVQLCIVNLDKEEYIQRKCENFKCTPCFSSGWGKKRFSYKIYSEANEYEFHGFSLIYYDAQKCEADRKVDLRCH